MFNIPITAPINWEPLPSIFLVPVVAHGKLRHELSGGLTSKIHQGEVIIETRKRGKIYWRKNQLRLIN